MLSLNIKLLIFLETSWEPPKEDYLSLKEQREEKDKETASQLKELDKTKRIEGLQRWVVRNDYTVFRFK